MKEFFSLAANWLQCRWHSENSAFDKVFLFIGEMDYASEMYLIIQEMKNAKR